MDSEGIEGAHRREGRRSGETHILPRGPGSERYSARHLFQRQRVVVVGVDDLDVRARTNAARFQKFEQACGRARRCR